MHFTICFIFMVLSNKKDTLLGMWSRRSYTELNVNLESHH